jgi:hypothetical protein
MQKDANLLLVNCETSHSEHRLTKKFSTAKKTINFHHSNKQAKALLLIAKLLKHSKAEDIFIISNAQTRKQLRDDLKDFIEEETSYLDATKHFMIQNSNSIVFLDTNGIDELNPKHLIALDLTLENKKFIEQSINKTSISVDIIYETRNDFLILLKEKYESN